MIRCLSQIEISLVSELMVQYLKPEGTFLFYAIITISGFFFIFYRVRETFGLNDK